MTRSWHLFLCCLITAPCGALAQTPIASMTEVDLARGRQLFEARCARCHGMRGTGGEGPSLARPTLRHVRDDESLVSVIRGGIPGTAMPGSWTMSDRESWQIAAYVRSLGRAAVVELPGDPSRGRQLFETRGGCTRCHTLRGEGTNLGPDLTAVGARRGPSYLRESIIDPGADLPQGLTPFYPAGFAEFLMVRAVTRDGRELSGMRVNEDSFTIQLRDEHGRIHSLRKDDLAELEKQFDQSFMPSYRKTFSARELDDLVAYLASLRGES